ncbi:MAG: DapH/DapD/GlmU-related protein [Ignavibacteriaceae bacterium]
MIQKLLNFHKKCRIAEGNFFLILTKHLRYKAHGKNILAHPSTKIVNLQNVTVNGSLSIGMDYVGFTNKGDRTFLRVNGKLIVNGNHIINKGCRFDIHENATVELGDSSYINPNSLFVISHSLKIGDNCAISWNCQFLDEDFHHISYPGRKESSGRGIVIGNRVWIGSNSVILKGTVIPDGCVIAANSVVRGSGFSPNSLIAGNPAKTIKTDVSWA